MDEVVVGLPIMVSVPRVDPLLHPITLVYPSLRKGTVKNKWVQSDEKKFFIIRYVYYIYIIPTNNVVTNVFIFILDLLYNWLFIYRLI